MIIQKTLDEENQNHRILPKIKCKICGREFEQITNTHLKTHGITMHEYRKRFPDALLASEGCRKKVSEAKSGENHPMYGKGYLIAGEKHPMFGKHHTKESNQKNRDAHLGKHFTEEHKQHISDNNGMKGKHHTEKAKLLISEANSGEKNPNYGVHRCGKDAPGWLGGISYLPYCEKFDNNLKERVRDFFGRCCYVCGKNEIENGRKLDVHHVNYNKMVCCNDIKPLFVPLCKSCHSKTLKDREYWEEFFTVSLNYLTDGKCFLPKKGERIMSIIE